MVRSRKESTHIHCRAVRIIKYFKIIVIIIDY
jgi:hypothetical protein